MEAVVLVALRFFEPLIFPVLVSSSAQDQKPGLLMVTGPAWRSGLFPAAEGDGLAAGVGDGTGAAGVAEPVGVTQRLVAFDLAEPAQPAESRRPVLTTSASAASVSCLREDEYTSKAPNCPGAVRRPG
jgi:hypothetical protein